MMKKYEYTVIPIGFGIKQGQNPALASQEQQHAINTMANDGWRYLRMDTITIPVKGGCLNFWASAPPISLHQLIFEREVTGAPPLMS